MKLAVPVLHPARGYTLLTEGFELDMPLIRKLNELDIHEFWIEYPSTEQIKQYVSPAVFQQQSQMISVVADMFDAVHQDAYARIDFPHYRRTLQSLIESLVNDPTAASYIVEMGGRGLNDLRHCSEVCFLSVLLGLKLQGYLIQQRKRLRPSDARDVVSLGLGAMLHDIGKMALPEYVRNRYETSRDQADREWRKHPELGHKLVTGTVAPAAAGCVLHHHQHFDGSGFPTSIGEDGKPHGLIGEQIHVFPRIVCVANHFDRMRKLGDGRLQPRVRVLKEMLLGPIASRFDPVVLAALPLVVPAYPPGSVVILNNREQAVVLQWHPEAPCQPTVQVIPGDHELNSRRFAEPVRYDLRDRTDLLVAEVDGVDVLRDNFRLMLPPDASKQNAA
jgi:HD-GYP domain-containing protein (c-di-GMP phosphodiesterase class II)